jgi:hypothetical protein
MSVTSVVLGRGWQGREYNVNLVIAVIVGTIVGVAGTVGGVAAYQGSPDGVSEIQLYSYADN